MYGSAVGALTSIKLASKKAGVSVRFKKCESVGIEIEYRGW
jgi:hypothetical protein